MASQQPMSARDRIRASERAHGYGVAQGSQAWASARRSGLDHRPMRSTRLPTPLQAPPPTPVPAAHAAAAAQGAALVAAAAQALTAEEAPDTTHEHPDDGYGTDTTELYEPLQEEVLLDDAPPQTDEGSQLRDLELEQEAAQLRLEVHNLQTELVRQRRLRSEQRSLNQLATGPYWISRTRR